MRLVRHARGGVVFLDQQSQPVHTISGAEVTGDVVVRGLNGKIVPRIPYRGTSPKGTNIEVPYATVRHETYDYSLSR